MIMINSFYATSALQSIVCFTIGSPFFSAGFLETLILGGLVFLLAYVSSHENVETSLLQNANLFSSFMDNLPGFAWIKDLDGRYVYVNRLIIERLTPFQSEWVGKTDADLWPPETAATYRVNDLKVIATGQPLEIVEHYLADGELRYLLVSKFPILDPMGKVTLVGGSSVDITALKRAEEEKERLLAAKQEADESLKLFRNLIDRSTEAIEVLDPTTLRFLDCNATAHECLGYTREEFLSLTAYDVDPAFTESIAATLMEEVDTSGSGIFEGIHRRKDGSTFPVEINAKTIRLDRAYRLAVVRDITERKLIEEKLRQSESQLAEAQRLAAVGSWNWDLRTNTVSWSDELFRIFGLEPQQLDVGKEAMELIHCQDRDLILNAIENSLRTKEPYNLYYRIRRPDSVERIVHTLGQVLSDEHGTPIRVFGATQDVTERMQAEGALRKAEQNYRDIFENAGEGIFQSTPEGKYIAANPTLARMHGFDSPEELIRGRTDISREIYADPARRQEFKRLLETNGIVRGFEHQVIRKDGSKIWITVNARAVRDLQAQVLYYEGTAQDITERKQAEGALRNSEERYRELFENAKDAYYVHDLSGRYISVNRAAEKLSGYSRADIIGRRFTDFVSPEQIEIVTAHLCGKMISDGETTYETEFIASDGRRVPIEVSSHLIIENGVGVRVQGAARDITERKRAEKRLREYEKAVEGLEEMIVVVDRNYHYLLANRAFLKYQGLERADVVGHSVAEFVSADIFQEVVKKKLDECFQGNIVKYELTFEYSKLGLRDLAISYFPIEEAGGIDRAACIFQDITDRKRAEQALRQSEDRFAKAFHSSPVALTIGSLEDGRLLEVNAAFSRMTGFTREESIGHTTLDLGLWTAGYRSALTEALRNHGAIDSLDIQFRKKSGEIRDGLLSAELIHLDAGACILGIAQDVTERNRAERALQGYPRQLIKAQEAERQSIARELHDQIGQVLTAIHLNLGVLRKTCAGSEAAALIDEGVGIVDQALNQVRDLSFELRPSLLDDLGLVAALRWYVDRFAHRTGINATIDIFLPENVMRLKHELETACFRIVQEALTNVARHAHARNVFINLNSLPDEIRLSIKDDGTGFKVDSQNFAQFTTHLGLRGMRERALTLGGSLEIISSADLGSEVRAVLPCQTSTDCSC